MKSFTLSFLNANNCSWHLSGPFLLSFMTFMPNILGFLSSIFIGSYIWSSSSSSSSYFVLLDFLDAFIWGFWLGLLFFDSSSSSAASSSSSFYIYYFFFYGLTVFPLYSSSSSFYIYNFFFYGFAVFPLSSSSSSFCIITFTLGFDVLTF